MQSPLLQHKKRAQNGKLQDEPAPKLSPPPRPPTPVNRIEQDYLQVGTCNSKSYFRLVLTQMVDVDGEETGSSTDSDSS